MIVDLKINDSKDLKKGDLLIFNGNQFDRISRDDFLKDIYKQLGEIWKKAGNQDTAIQKNAVKISKFQSAIKTKIGAFITAFKGSVKK